METLGTDTPLDLEPQDFMRYLLTGTQRERKEENLDKYLEVRKLENEENSVPITPVVSKEKKKKKVEAEQDYGLDLSRFEENFMSALGYSSNEDKDIVDTLNNMVDNFEKVFLGGFRVENEDDEDNNDEDEDDEDEEEDE